MTRRTILAAACCITSLLSFCAPHCAAQTPATLPTQTPTYQRAQQAFAAKRFREAADLFAAAAAAERAQRSNAPASDASLMQAKSLVNLGDFSAADPVLQVYLQQNPRSSQAFYLLGYVLQRENKPKQSLQAFTRAAGITPPLPNDLKIVALDYILLDDYIDAVRWLERSVAADPLNAEAWYDLGRAEMHQGNFTAAERAFHHTLSLEPRNSKALDNLGLALEAQNRPAEALDAYAQAIEAQGTAPHLSEQPLLNYGALLNTRNRSADAIDPLRRAAELTPSCSRCHEELARAYAGTHQEVLARREMEQAVTLDPRNPRLHYQLGQFYRRAGMSEKAQQELKQSSDLYGTHSANPDR